MLKLPIRLLNREQMDGRGANSHFVLRFPEALTQKMPAIEKMDTAGGRLVSEFMWKATGIPDVKVDLTSQQLAWPFYIYPGAHYGDNEEYSWPASPHMNTYLNLTIEDIRIGAIKRRRFSGELGP